MLLKRKNYFNQFYGKALFAKLEYNSSRRAALLFLATTATCFASPEISGAIACVGFLVLLIFQ